LILQTLFKTRAYRCSGEVSCLRDKQITHTAV